MTAEVNAITDGTADNNMNMNENFIDVAVASIGIIFSYFFGELDGLIIALIVFTIIDYISGITAASMEGKLNSREGFNGIKKKVFIFLLVGVAHVSEQVIDNDSALLRNGVICFYLSNEGISILENSVKIGLPIPEMLKNILEKLNKDNNKEVPLK